MKILAWKAYPQRSNQVREHLILRGFFEGIEHIQVRLNVKKNVADADINLDKALERALHIETITRIEEEDNEQRVFAIQSNENTKLVNSINDLLRTLQTNQTTRKNNQKLLSPGGSPKEFLQGSERSSREIAERNINYNSYKKSSADNRRNNCNIRAQSTTQGDENRSRDRTHESCAEQ